MAPLWRGLTSNFSQSHPGVIFEGDSKYHHITIADKSGVRTLYLGPAAEEAETSVLLANPEAPIFEYPGLFFLALALTPRNKNILMLGLGGGFIPRLFSKYLKDHHLTVVEVDPLVAELARTYFGFEQGDNVKLVISDGLEFISKAANSHYDQIWLDAFNGNYIPDHLSSTDFLVMVKMKLVEEGLLVQNLHQTAWIHYQMQLKETVMIFSQPPLLFSGTRCANTVSMSINSETIPLPSKTEAIIAKVKAFQPRVGPYDLTEEAQKVMKRAPDIPPLP